MSPAAVRLRLALLLAAACALAAMAVLPYQLALLPAAATALVKLPVLLAVAAAQGALLGFLLSWVGLRLGASLRLGAPWLESWLSGGPRPSSSAWPAAALLGAVTGAAIIGLSLAFGPIVGGAGGADVAPAVWKGLLASAYGGVFEEVLLRLFVMTGLVWLLARLAPKRPAWVFWGAIVLAALLFGAAHLPTAAQLMELSPAVVGRVVLYNAVGGLAFGWLYWKRGLEHAILAHFCADLVLHVLLPLTNLA